MKYRAEIDGLRAVAVLPVIFFHAGFAPFSGGFVGVDVFFVISGYLITSLILEELKTGRFSIAGFYDRRARRILPALFFVVACTIPIAWFTLLPKDLTDFFHSVMAVSLFSSNFLFWFQSGYFDTGAELKPLLHTWSLAVEEQFYIIFPLLLMALWRFGRKVLIWVLVVLFVISASLAEWGAHNYPSATFFLLHARGWELLIGAFAAFYLQGGGQIRPGVISNILSALGLLLIFYAVVDYNERTPFPSVYALVPTVGTVLVILFAVPGTVAHRLLSLKACVGIGLLSYSMYLWHQPIFVFARYLFGLPVGSYVFLALTVLATLLALFSWRFVERPFRRKGFAVSRVLTAAAAASIAILATGYFLPKIENPTTDELDYATHWIGWTTCYPFGTREEAGGGCRILKNDAAPTLAIIGDSHAGHLATGLKAILDASDENPLVLLSPGCYPAITQPNEYERFLKCENNFIDKAITYVSQKPSIKKVILSGYGNLELHKYKVHQTQKLDPAETEIREGLLLNGLREAVGLLLSSGKKLRLISENPEMIDHPAHCSTKLARWLGTCPQRVALSDVNARATQIDRIIRGVKDFHPKLEVFDPRSVLCDAEFCYSGSTEKNWYQTRDHLTPAGSIKLVKEALKGF
ncbi:acyltransferase family protein [uncultured Roseovarius sp.]|uniref:acyltransferase family protein n=1 Tax=uncultured Roseovarius sp. TaxID=293344 RepID=UPI00262B9700|nr:acyltransferase family protein [uncultured Roseovarius sp.]